MSARLQPVPELRMVFVNARFVGVGVGVGLVIRESIDMSIDVEERSACPGVPRWSQPSKGTLSDTKHQTTE